MAGIQQNMPECFISVISHLNVVKNYTKMTITGQLATGTK